MLVEDIITQIIPIFRNELDEENLVLTPGTTANDVENWDSITNIQIIVAVENFTRSGLLPGKYRILKMLANYVNASFQKPLPNFFHNIITVL